jgi:NADH dehydrogenase (ubiquinone) 1 alpha subcomplex subunit 13
MLEAEVDRDAVRRHFATIEKEKEIMKDVPGWDAEESVYNDKKFRRPTFVSLPKF